MNPREEEFEESLKYMREQFTELTNSIKIPDSLNLDSLKKQLEAMEIEPDNISHKTIRFPMRTVMSMAACIAIVSVSFLSYQLGSSRASNIEAPTSVAQGAPATMEASPEISANTPAPAAMEALPQQAPPILRAVRSETLTLEEAKLQWGNYLPRDLPRGIQFSGAIQQDGTLMVSYLNDDYSRQIQMSLILPSENPGKTVDITIPEQYDLRLYDPPYTDNVPEEFAQTLNAPLFAWEDFTEELVEARIFDPNGGGERGNFGILFPDGTVTEVNATGVSATEVYDMLVQIKP